MALIELEVAIEVLEHAAEHYSHIDDCTEHTILQCISTIKKVPTVDAAPVVHGRWENIETTAYGLCYATCSECGYRCTRDTVMGKVSERICKDCGARMDRGDGHEAD